MRRPATNGIDVVQVQELQELGASGLGMKCQSCVNEEASILESSRIYT